MMNMYGSEELTDYLVYFVHHLDPNGGKGLFWPRYTSTSKEVLTFFDGPLTTLGITRDDYRTEGMRMLTEISLQYPL